MAKYVLLEFDDDAEADKLINNAEHGIMAAAPVWSDDAMAHVYLKPAIRGVWKRPTKFCDCKTSRKGRAFTRGKKYGWWVCTGCNKPTRSWGRGDHWFIALGRNLLPLSNKAPEYRGDGVFARHFKPCPDCGTNLLTDVSNGENATATVYCPKCEKHV